MANSINFKKNIFVLCWTIFSSFIIWAMNLVRYTEFNIESFLWFTIMFLISGFSFNFLTEMIRTPISTQNNDKWNNFGIKLVLCAFIIIAVVGVAYLEKNVCPMGGFLTLFAILVATFFLTQATAKAHSVFAEIKER